MKKRFKIGDKVQITNPAFFVRVGFPLTKPEIRDNVEYHDVIHREVLNLLTKEGVPWFDNGKYIWKVYDKIRDLLIYSILKAKNFGGNERKIYTDLWKGSIDNVLSPFEIVGKNIVRTGIYEKGRIKGRNNLILTIQHKNGWNAKIEAKNVRLLEKAELALMD